MPQLFHVVRCYACHIFQVHQVKKALKWVCKMCGEKQSLKKEYGSGSGLECRHHVQKLNMMAGDREASESRHGDIQESDGDVISPRNEHLDCQTKCQADCTRRVLKPDLQQVEKHTKWQDFLEEDTNDDDIDAPPPFDVGEVTLSRPVYQGRGETRRGSWNSGRKRKRQDVFQDSDTKSRLENDEMPSMERSGWKQNLRTSSTGCREVHRPDAAAVESFPLGSQEIAGAVASPRASWTQSGVAPAREEDRNMEAVGASKKWQQFLQDDDEKCNTETSPHEISGNLKRVADPGGALGPEAGSKWGCFLEEIENVNSDYESPKSSISKNLPVGDVSTDKSVTLSEDGNLPTDARQSSGGCSSRLKTEFQSEGNIFSLGDEEHFWEEAFNDNW